MPVKLKKIWVAAILALASLPALAADMPASGTKNFIPGGDAPSYFTNESGAVSGMAAVDQTTSDDGVDRIFDSPRSETEPMRSAKTTARRHGGPAVSHRWERHNAANFKAKGHSVHAAGAIRTRIASVGAPVRSTRTAGRTTNQPKAKSDRTAIARPAKSNARHAAAKSVSRKG
jgi:hypothetical protein